MKGKKIRDLTRTLSYLINPESASLLLSSKPRPQTVRLDSLFKSWGLLPGQYMNDGSIISTKFGKIHQIFTILVLGYHVIKLFITTLFDKDSIYLIYIGDMAIIFMDMCPRIYFHALWMSMLLNSFLMAICYYVNRNTDNFCWLRTTQLTKG